MADSNILETTIVIDVVSANSPLVPTNLSRAGVRICNACNVSDICNGSFIHHRIHTGIWMAPAFFGAIRRSLKP